MKATKKIVMKKRARIQGLQIISGNSYVKYNNFSQSSKKDDNKLKKKYIHILKSNFCPNCSKILRVICRASLLQSVNSRYVFIFLTLQYLPFIGHKKSVIFTLFLFYRLAKSLIATYNEAMDNLWVKLWKAWYVIQASLFLYI